MEEFNLMLNHDEPLEIATRAFYGYDADNGIGSSFNPNRDYFRFNGYGISFPLITVNIMIF